MIEIINGTAFEFPDKVKIDTERLKEVSGITYVSDGGQRVHITFVSGLQNMGGGNFVFYDQNRALHRLRPGTEILKVEYQR